MTKVYTGIGARNTPSPVLNKIIYIAKDLAQQGWILRSGGSDGADTAFEDGCNLSKGEKQIYLPWKGFNSNSSNLYLDLKDDEFGIQTQAWDIAASVHPAWNKLKHGVRLLHTRNVFQILGWDLKSPTGMVVAWTSHGKEIGGTRTGLVLAKQYNIPIINLAVDEFKIPERKKLHCVWKGEKGE
jgi:hypothetical protein